MRVETVHVVNPADKTGGSMVINKTDYEANKFHEKNNADGFKLHESNEKAAPAAQPGPTEQRNNDGTFQEPTPTDIRYKDKDGTEFANNHGGLIGASAAELREANDMPDEPGGLVPEQHEKVQEAEALTREVAEAPKKAGRAAGLARRVPPKAAARRK